ncbi:MAG: radical SAM protein [Candidatus Shapirobacteria bacterium]|jgi:MoaA/NifB/PqqE/SkfB family radical SAM enzyme
MLKKIINIVRGSFRPKKINQIIFFITGNCNLKCQHCFYWKNLNDQEDISIDKIKKLSLSLPKFNFLLLSGGEPFLRKEIEEIIDIFSKNNFIKAVAIPSNGFAVDLTIKKIKLLTTKFPNINFYINFSLDGLKKTHEEIRSVKNSYRNVITSIKRAGVVSQKTPNLFIGINSVISAKNIDQIDPLIKKLKIIGRKWNYKHYFEIIRGNPRMPLIKNLNSAKAEKLFFGTIIDYQKYLWSKNNNSWLNASINRLITEINFYFQYKLQLDNVFRRKPWPMPCMAGKTIITVNHRGEIGSCELRKPLVNLKNIEYNLGKFLKSKKMNQEIISIKNDRCFCSHICFISESLYNNPKTLVFTQLYTWLKYRMFNP